MEMPLRTGMHAEATETPPFVSSRITRTKILSHTERNNCWALEGNSVESQINWESFCSYRRKICPLQDFAYIDIKLLVFFKNKIRQKLSLLPPQNALGTCCRSQLPSRCLLHSVQNTSIFFSSPIRQSLFFIPLRSSCITLTSLWGLAKSWRCWATILKKETSSSFRFTCPSHVWGS